MAPGKEEMQWFQLPSVHFIKVWGLLFVCLFVVQNIFIKIINYTECELGLILVFWKQPKCFCQCSCSSNGFWLNCQLFNQSNISYRAAIKANRCPRFIQHSDYSIMDRATAATVIKKMTQWSELETAVGWLSMKNQSTRSRCSDWTGDAEICNSAGGVKVILWGLDKLQSASIRSLPSWSRLKLWASCFTPPRPPTKQCDVIMYCVIPTANTPGVPE